MIKLKNEQHQTELSVLGFLMASTRAPYLAGDMFSIGPIKAFLHSDTGAIITPFQRRFEQGGTLPTRAGESKALPVQAPYRDA